MGKKRKKTTPEFRREAFRGMEQGGNRTVAEVARELGVATSKLDGWRAAQYRGGELPERSVEESPQQELSRLRRENREWREDKALLKKAASLFAQESDNKERQQMMSLIDSTRHQYSRCRLCNLFGVSPSAFYEWQQRKADKEKTAGDDHIRCLAKEIWLSHHKRLGLPRLRHLLAKDHRMFVGPPRLRRLMNEAGIS